MPKKNPKEMISIFKPFQPVKVKYKDIFDMKEFYTALHDWMGENGWVDAEERLDHYETLYGERIDRGGAKELWIHWRPTKPAPSSDFLRYHLDIDYHCLALTTTEVIREGQKFKANKGEVEVTIRAYIEKLYEPGFKGQFLGQFKDLFNKRIYRQTLEQRKKELYQEVYVLQHFIKSWFKLKRYHPYEENKTFFTSYAWPSHLKKG